MIFVIGGRNQGKTALARQLWKNTDNPRIADGRMDSLDAIWQADLILHYESLVRRLMEEIKEDPAAVTKRLLQEKPDVIITADEIGCGVVPMGEFEREYREMDGRLCQQIAASARQVYRVICGIGTRIK